MTTNLRRLRRAAAGLAGGLVASSLLAISPAGSAAALEPGDPPSGTISIIGSNLNSSSNWMLDFDQQNSYCDGDGVAGYRWHTFIVPATADPTTLTFPGAGSPVSPGGGYVRPLINTSGSPVRAQTPTTVNGSEGFINLTSVQFNFTSGAFGTTQAGSPAHGGSFWIGIACTAESSVGTNVEYWSTMITTTPQAGAGTNNFTFVQGAPEAAPAAPTLNTVTPGNGTLTAAFSAVTANPAVTGYTVTATDGTNTFTAAGASSPLTVTGLTNGTAYDVSVVATNSVGDSPASNVVEGTPVAGAQPAPTNVTAVPGANAGEINVSWTAPAGLTPTGYTLAVTPADPGDPAVDPSQITITGTTAVVTGMPSGAVYDYVVTATYADPSAVATPSAPVQAAASAAATIQQEVVVERPAGALILTQRCGVNNVLAAEPADAGFPGFPAVDEVPATGDQVGTSPDADLTTAGQQDDSEFGDYPFANPATYPTRCVIDLGTAELLTSGDLAGQYYAADGALNEVTVVDTREGDNGWTVTGSIPSLTNGGGNADDSFSGDLVGWTPVVTDDSEPVAAGEYDQVVTAGEAIVPGTTGGLAAPAGQVLASADPGSGLGIAVLDARVKVLIPVANATGEYTGVLTLNAS